VKVDPESAEARAARPRRGASSRAQRLEYASRLWIFDLSMPFRIDHVLCDLKRVRYVLQFDMPARFSQFGHMLN
jgi:hypothetical protein